MKIKDIQLRYHKLIKNIQSITYIRNGFNTRSNNEPSFHKNEMNYKQYHTGPTRFLSNFKQHASEDDIHKNYYINGFTYDIDDFIIVQDKLRILKIID